MLNEIQVKQMTSEHRDEFIDMYNSFDDVMLLPKDSVHSLSDMLRVYDLDICQTFGAYYNEKLVGTLAGRFYPNYQFWNGSNLFTRIRPFVKNLNLHLYSMIVSLELFEVLINYAESVNRFSFFTNKNLRHQLNIERSMNKIRVMQQKGLIKHYRMLDYIVLYERIYPKGYTRNSQISEEHKPFYKLDTTYDAETIVVLHTLNQLERKN